MDVCFYNTLIKIISAFLAIRLYTLIALFFITCDTFFNGINQLIIKDFLFLLLLFNVVDADVLNNGKIITETGYVFYLTEIL